MSLDPTVPPRGATVREIFLGALELRDPAQRASFLDQACHGNLSLRHQVAELLAAEADLGSFLVQPAVADAHRPPSASASSTFLEKAGDRIGPYRLLQEIGEGGCGVVFLAEQESPVRRRVALKVIKQGMDTRQVIARFEAERQALAMMDHPNIARVLDADATSNGRPYFVMELVSGTRITEFCDHQKLSARERIRLLVKICHAVQHAHQKGVIHRDLKPSNILVGVQDGAAVAKVIDFGIAKATDQRLTEKTLFTEFHAFIGTPAYMSPEQAQMGGLDVDTRTDIYSLGVLLYELLTGRTPFATGELLRDGLDACRRTILEVDPLRPSTRVSTLVAGDRLATAQMRGTDAPRLVHLLRGDLDWIVMKCLEKDRARRYETANALALDLVRYLENEPVSARPPSQIYRLQKLVRRHRGTFAAAAGVTLALMLGAGLAIWQAIRATQAEQQALASREVEASLRRKAEREGATARLNEYVAHINLAHQSLGAGNVGRALQLLEKYQPRPGQPDLRGFEWRYLWRRCHGDDHVALEPLDASIRSFAFSPDGSRMVIGLDQRWMVRDTLDDTTVVTRPGGALSMAYLPDGQSLVVANPSEVKVWRTANWELQTTLPGVGGPIDLSRDGRRLACVRREGISLRDTSDWRELRLLPDAQGPLAFSPDGQRLVADSRDGLVIWDVTGNSAPRTLEDSAHLFGRWHAQAKVVAFTEDGRSVMAPRNEVSIRGAFVISLWDVETGKINATLPSDATQVEHTGMISCVAVSPDGRSLATGSWDHSIQLWDLDQHQHQASLQGHRNEVWSAKFTPNGRFLATGAKDGGIHLWPLNAAHANDGIAGRWRPLAFSRDGKTLAALGPQQSLEFLDVESGRSQKQFRLSDGPIFPFLPVTVSQDLRWVIHGTTRGTVQILDTSSNVTQEITVSDRPVLLAAVSPDSELLVTAPTSGPITWRELSNPTAVGGTLEGYRGLFAGNGRTFVSWNSRGDTTVWDVATRTARFRLRIDPVPRFAVAISHDGRRLAVTTGPTDLENAVRLWDLDRGRLIGACTGQKQPVYTLAFSHDGRTLAGASAEGALRLWNVASQQELLTFRRLGEDSGDLMFSPDDNLLAVSNGGDKGNERLRFYDAPVFDGIETKSATRRDRQEIPPRD
ncbi:MAG: serine/threonine protein kinase [Verrucomicrobiales bacterium]|nr:serine/threonine protein kinase [Verrucomicrobiales bacterium]